MLKRRITVISLLVLLLLICVLFIKPNDTTELKKIKAAEVSNLLDKSEETTSFVMIGNRTCSSCREFRPILEKALKNSKKSVYYIDTQDSENNSFLSSENIHVTPTLLMIKDKSMLRAEGVLSLEDTKKFLDEKYKF
ncbi:putative bacteriocin transport accessory protein [Enterococcus faecalis 13-SD-W-01]|nr:putative bacteriocin transport accessory protein [Enterococcus faecalis 13-SD-W-01]